MAKFKYLLGGLIGVAQSLFAGSFFTPYANYITYNNSIKQSAYNIGGYYTSYNNYTKFEIDSELTKIYYKKSNTNSYNDNPYSQGDLTLVFNAFNKYLAGRIGTHTILHYQKGDVGRHHDSVYLAGVKIYNNNIGIGFGANYYYSDYENFNVRQSSPYVYLNHFIPKTFIQLTYNNIKISKNFINLSKSYKNYDLLVNYFFENFSIGTNISMKKSAYKVSNGGFVVSNLSEEQDGSYSIFTNIKLSEKTNLKITYKHSKFEENRGEGSSTSNLFGASLGFYF